MGQSRMQISASIGSNSDANQQVDGLNSLPDQDAESGEHRDEFACARLQSEASHEHPGC